MGFDDLGGIFHLVGGEPLCKGLHGSPVSFHGAQAENPVHSGRVPTFVDRISLCRFRSDLQYTNQSLKYWHPRKVFNRGRCFHFVNIVDFIRLFDYNEI